MEWAVHNSITQDQRCMPTPAIAQGAYSTGSTRPQPGGDAQACICVVPCQGHQGPGDPDGVGSRYGAPGSWRDAAGVRPARTRGSVVEGDHHGEAYTGMGLSDEETMTQGRDVRIRRRQYVRGRYARTRRPGGIKGHITQEGNALESGRPHLVAITLVDTGRDRKSHLWPPGFQRFRQVVRM